MNLAQLIKSHLDRDDANQALEYNARWYDWAELRNIAAKVDTALMAAGIGPGARVALVARNRPALVASLLCLMATARQTVMVYAFQTAAALAQDLRELGVAAVIADDEDWSVDAHGAIADADALGLSVSSEGDLSVRAVGRLERSATFNDSASDIAVEMLTSGTTGAPKRIGIRWSTLNAAAEDLIGSDPDRSAGSSAPPDILPFPIGNISGLYYLIPAVGMGRRFALLERFTLDEWLSAVRRHGPAYAAVPPAAIRMLMDGELREGDLGRLGVVGVGAAPLDPKLQEQFEARFKIPVLIGYGATEFCGVITTWTAEDHAAFAETKRGSVGRARPGVTLRIIDRDTGLPCPIGSAGIIEAQVARIGPHFVRTTDLGHVDADGFLFLHGRADQIINRGGFKVDPAKITAALCSHPAVADAGVVGIVDSRLGEVPMAAVELRPGQPRPSEEELLTHLRARLRSVELPRRICVLDALPRTPSMKVRLADLRILLGTSGA